MVRRDLLAVAQPQRDSNIRARHPSSAAFLRRRRQLDIVHSGCNFTIGICRHVALI